MATLPSSDHKIGGGGKFPLKEVCVLTKKWTTGKEDLFAHIFLLSK